MKNCRAGKGNLPAFHRNALQFTDAVQIVEFIGIGALTSAIAPSPAILIVSRVVLGLAIGLASTNVPVYLSEVAPARARGWVVSLFQLAVTIGIVIAYLTDYAFAGMEGWRWMLGLAVVPALVFGAGMFFLPETPRWLIRGGQHEVAHRVLIRIRELADVDVEIEEIKASLAQQTESGRWVDLLSQQVRPALIVGLGLAIFQQITGINTVIYYAPKILQAAGFNSASGAILATAGVGVVNVSMTIIAMFLVDRAGRRPLLLVGIAGMIVTLGMLGLSFRISNQSVQLAWIAVICLMGYVASFAISLGPIFWLMIAEIYPLKIRGLAEGMAATFNWGSNLLVSLTFLTLVEKLGASSTFLLYAFASVASWLFAYYLVPETKGRTLEEIEAFWRTDRRHRQMPN